MPTSFNDFTKHYIKTPKSGGCAYRKNGKCQLDGSLRRWDCHRKCPRYKPCFKDRLWAAWYILMWDKDFIR